MTVSVVAGHGALNVPWARITVTFGARRHCQSREHPTYIEASCSAMAAARSSGYRR
jgi:hypothetical protein